MRLFTIQPIEVSKILEEKGRFVCDFSELMKWAEDNNCNEILDAYTWMMAQMKKRIGPSPEGAYYPIWAWAKNDDDNVNDSCARAGKLYARIELEIDPSRVLLSDFDEWNNSLNGWPCIEDEEISDEEWNAIVAAGKEVVAKSWEYIFDTSKSDYIQAVLWELRKEDVVSVKTFVGAERKYEYEDEDNDYEEELGA